MDGPLMERITDKLLAMQGAESYDIKLMQKQLAEVEKGIENMLNAIQAGIITASTKQRLADLESQKGQLEESILKEKIKRPVLNREEISFFLNRFKHTDITDEQQRQRLIDFFVNAVYVYDDKIVLVFNYKDGTKTVKLSDIESSDLLGGSPPPKPLEILGFQGVLPCLGKCFPLFFPYFPETLRINCSIRSALSRRICSVTCP